MDSETPNSKLLPSLTIKASKLSKLNPIQDPYTINMNIITGVWRCCIKDLPAIKSNQ